MIKRSLKKKVGKAPAKKAIALPTRKTKPLEGIQNYAIYVYGKAGIGKTSFSSMFPNSLHIFYEPSGDALELYSVEPKTWDELEQYVELLEEQKEAGTLKFETVVIDVVDLCYKSCIEHICKPMDCDWPPQDYGKTWTRIKDTFRALMYRIKRITGLVLISHAVERDIERLDGMSYSTLVPTISGSGNDVITKFCGVQGFYTMDNRGKRILVIEPNNTSEVKNRIKNHFLYTDGSKILEIPMGKSEEESWKFFIQAFENKLKKPNIKTKTKNLRLKRS